MAYIVPMQFIGVRCGCRGLSPAMDYAASTLSSSLSLAAITFSYVLIGRLSILYIHEFGLSRPLTSFTSARILMADARTDNGSDSRRQHRARGQSALGHDALSNKARGPSYEETLVLLRLNGFFTERRTRRRILGPSHPRLQQVEKEREQDQVSMALSACERSRHYNPRILFEHVYRADFETAQSELGIYRMSVEISPPWNPELLYLAASRSDPKSHNIVWLLIINDMLKDWKNRESVSKKKIIMMMSMAVLAALKNDAFLNAWILRAFGAAWVPECRWRVRVPDDAYWRKLQNKLEQWTPDTYLLPENGMEREVLVHFIDAKGRMDFKRC